MSSDIYEGKTMKKAKRLLVFALTGLLSFFVGVSVTRLRAFLAREHSEPSPWQVLLSFENQDLQSLNDDNRSKVRQAVLVVTNQLDSDLIERFRPVLLKSIANTSGEKRYLLVEEQPLWEIPGESRLRIHVLDNCGRLLSKEEFAAGYRTALVAFRVRQLEVLDHDTLIVDGER
jgi:hypothetical protein